MCCSFQSASCNLRETLAGTTRRICSSFVDPEPMKPLTAYRLIALDKCPGVRPIGIGEVSRRIMSKKPSRHSRSGWVLPAKCGTGTWYVQ